MAIPLAWKNLKHNWVRTGVGMAGVGFAAILIFMQMGFRGAIIKTATQIYQSLDFELMIRSPEYLHLTEASTISDRRLLQVAALPQVASVKPFHVTNTEWKTPQRGQNSTPLKEDNQYGIRPGLGRGIIVMGIDPSQPPFVEDERRLNDAASLLISPHYVLVDVKSKPEYGPQVVPTFSKADKDVETGLGPSRKKIVGLFELGAGMVSNGACMTNRAGYLSAYPLEKPGSVSLGLIKLETGVDKQAAAELIRRALGIQQPPLESGEDPRASDASLSGDDVVVLTYDQVVQHEEKRWMEQTPFGLIFTLGVAVAIFVGVAIVYQVLSNDIANLMGEYATLKAMGYGNDYLSAVVMKQAVLLALVSYVPSLVISWILYGVVGGAAGVPMEMNHTIMLTVLCLTVLMCVVSGTAALRKLFSADPASLF